MDSQVEVETDFWDTYWPPNMNNSGKKCWPPTPKKGRQLDPRIPSIGPLKTPSFFLWIESDQLYYTATILCGFDATILRQTNNVR